MRKLLFTLALLCLISSSCKSSRGPIDPVQLTIPTDYQSPTNAPPIQ
jgi:hypothetical protein